MRATLNLLSPEKKAALRSGFALAYAQTLTLLLFTVSIFAFGSLLAVRMIMMATRDDLASRSAQGQDEVSTVTQEVRLINDYVDRVDQYQKRFTPWSSFMITLTGLIPARITVDEIRVEDDVVSISGVAATRDDVLALQSNLRGSGLFKDVRSPIANILQQENVAFAFQMTLPPKEGVIVNAQ